MPNPFIPLPDTAQVQMIYTSANEPCENVYYVQGATGWDIAGLTALVTYFAAWESGTAHTMRSDNVILTLIRAVDFSTSTGAEVETPQAITGTLTPNHLPNNVTWSIKANTGLRGRSFRGRTYWIGLNGAQVDTSGQSVLNAPATNIVAGLNTLRTGALPNSGKLVVASRFSGGNPRAVGVCTPIIEYVAIDQFTDSQRRRLHGHNRHH